MQNRDFIAHTMVEGNIVYQVFAGRKLSDAEINRAIRDQSVRRETRTEKQGKQIITRVSIFIDDAWLNAR